MEPPPPTTVAPARVPLTPCLAAFGVDPFEEHIIALADEGSAVDADFLLLHLLKQVLGHNVLLVCLHRTANWYRDVLKRRMNCNVPEYDRSWKTVNVLEDWAGTAMRCDVTYLQALLRKIEELLDANEEQHTLLDFVVVDDLSHLLDVCNDEKLVHAFLARLMALVDRKADRRKLIVKVHTDDVTEARTLWMSLRYASDVAVLVAPLQTGRSTQVSGLVRVFRPNAVQPRTFHYKVYDRGVKVFHPGESLQHLYK